MSNPKVLVGNVSAHSMLRDGKKLLNVAFTDINFAANMLADRFQRTKKYREAMGTVIAKDGE